MTSVFVITATGRVYWADRTLDPLPLCGFAIKVLSVWELVINCKNLLQQETLWIVTLEASKLSSLNNKVDFLHFLNFLLVYFMTTSWKIL